MVILIPCFYKNNACIILWPGPKGRYADLNPPSFAPIFMQDAQCAESNEKTIFGFYFTGSKESE